MNQVNESSPKAGRKSVLNESRLMGVTVLEVIGIGVINPDEISCPVGYLRVEDERRVEEWGR
jgi:hypothetical protein